MTTVLGRRVLLTTLDPVPRSMRAVPGILALNSHELQRLNDGDADVFKEIADIVQAEDMADARLVWVRRKIPKRKEKLAPSARMFMLNAVIG